MRDWRAVEDYCCKMREKFMLGIVAEHPGVPVPTDAIDFLDFETKTESGKPILRIKFCPFCGKAVTGPLRAWNQE